MRTNHNNSATIVASVDTPLAVADAGRGLALKTLMQEKKIRTKPSTRPT